MSQRMDTGRLRRVSAMAENSGKWLAACCLAAGVCAECFARRFSIVNPNTCHGARLCRQQILRR